MDSTDGPPNILFLVWDACRLDYAREHASNLGELADSGVWFEKAVAPATWSLPSHASLFTGQPPHEHGVTQPSQSRVPTDLVDELKSNEYTCYGVSGNGFASPLWGFDEPFDDFRSTRGPEPYVDGLDVYTQLRSDLEAGTPKLSLLRQYFTESLAHPHPAKSLANLAAVGINHVSREVVPALQAVPHDVFRTGIRETYAPEKNTRAITNFLREEAESESPFFVFSNYMDTHRPYAPPEDLQRKHLGAPLDDAEIRRLNDEVAGPWKFIQRVENGEVDDSDVDTLQKLYAGEVESVDRHLGRLLAELRRNDLFENTLVVVTSDHGENLGSPDSHGDRRFGHEASLSDDLCRVPLVVSHPDIEPGEVSELFSLTSLYDVILDASRRNAEFTVDDIRDQCAPRVACEYPALGDESFYDEHPDIDRAILEQRVERDSLAAYENDWRAMLESGGTRLAEHRGEPADVGEAPESLVEFSEAILERLGHLNQVDVDVDTQNRLEDLGYL
ncbi:sulfatase [Halobacterium wangiae]|uniref:sulfatase n=1 Tax=Halobacterium wangiae TaxID=2902623 RepID=UPI001E61484B|nr:sulfatase [Halobacterium wangiae]